MITVPQQLKNFLEAGAKKSNSHINGCLITLLLNVVFLVFKYKNSLNIRFETGVLNTLGNDPGKVDSNFFCYAATMLSPIGMFSFLLRECINLHERSLRNKI